MVSTLEQLRKYSTVVADTCDFELISHYEPKVKGIIRRFI